MKRIIAILTFILVLNFSSAFPQNSERLSKKELATLVANAQTPAEHRRIAAYYSAEAARLMTESSDHAQMAAGFRRNAPNKSTAFQVEHCEYLTHTLKAKADKALYAASEHERMAQATKLP
jgi:hypothetical protein